MVVCAAGVYVSGVCVECARQAMVAGHDAQVVATGFKAWLVNGGPKLSQPILQTTAPVENKMLSVRSSYVRLRL